MEIADIKAHLPISAVLSHYGLQPDCAGRLRCPFHDDKTPSMQVYKKTQTCYCFSGNCATHGKSLDVIDFVMHKEQCSKGEAIRYCERLCGGAIVSAVQPSPRVTPPASVPPVGNILEQMFTYFRNAVASSKPAQDYIRSRGLDATRLEVGYNSAQFHHGSRKDAALIDACVQAGLLTPWGTNTREGGQAYKPFGKYCVVFALRSRGGAITGMYFRSTVNDSDAKHFYLKDRKGLYPCHPATDAVKLLLTESVIDAATLLQHETITREYAVLACYGTNGFTDEHAAAIASLPQLREIIFAFDGDDAGNKAVQKYAAQLHAQYPQLQFTTLELPAGEDINSMSCTHEPEIFSALLDSRQPVVLSSTENNTFLQSATSDASDVSELDTRNPHKLRYSGAAADYEVQGGVSKGLDSLKVTLVITGKGSGRKSRQKLDLYEEKAVDKCCRELSEKLFISQPDLSADLYRLTDLLETYRERELLLSEQPEPAATVDYPLTAVERAAAEEFLRAPDLLGRINGQLEAAGIIGEESNRLLLWLIASSHKLAEPLHALIQGSSGSGKTRLLKQVSACMPPERLTKLTRVSEKVFYNYPETYFVHRLLCLEDIDGLGEEAEFALRELQSNGELTSAMSIKLESGQITSGQKTVRGPIASLACTTRGEWYEDNMSRVFLVAVDERATQTARILDYQNRKAAGQLSSDKERAATLQLQQLVRALGVVEVVNPYAGRLQLPPEAHKLRRLNDLFLNFVKVVTWVHQYQRKRDGKNRLLVEISDLAQAVDILFDSIVLKVDELDGSLRQFFEQLKNYLQKTHADDWQKATFTLREVRQGLNVSKTQLFRYVNDLLRLEYIRITGGHVNRGFTYQISYWDGYTALRERLRKSLTDQLAALQAGGENSGIGTPELATVAECE
ncbi:toprim domain-containing protein [Chitinophaga sp. GCM10012297]|uniref:Toprim domain-containing protein n=1 Tax=Chitinophaga chungangae TaxID=2821488 RepID=A0ABS3YHB1_9BACT|nr:toprim domain-containing protein [Chitinophaga chungangae]MBO9154082.1 toprim domain-containing protein [Chitinophaga chungangae]